MSDVSKYLPKLLGPHSVTQDGGDEVTARSKWNFVGVEITDDPTNEQTTFTATGGASTGSNLGAALEVFKDVSAGDIRHRTLRFAGKKTSEQDPAGYAGEIWARPCPPGWFNPIDYGAKFDGLTDDLAALQAMHDAMPDWGGRVHWPDGVAYVSDEWLVSKPLHISGHGGTGGEVCMIEVAPGRRAAITIDTSTVSQDGNTAQGLTLERLDVRSKILVHPTATGSALGLGLPVWYSGGTVRKGDLYVAEAEASPTKAFRAGSAGTFAISQPTWNTTVGVATVSNGITFTCESIPSVRQDSHAYNVGDRVYARKDNRFLFLCTASVGNTAASPPTEMLGGDTATGVELGGSVTDGGVTWLVTMACGVFLRAPLCKIGQLDARGFTGYGVHVQAGAGVDIEGSTNADNFIIDTLNVSYCGGGLYVAGDDTNGYRVDSLFGISLGVLQPTPTIAAAASYTQLGGHILHDHSATSGKVTALYAQISTGRCILKTGNGRITADSSFHELGIYGGALVAGGYATFVGGDIFDDAGNALVLIPGNCKNIIEHDDSGASALVASLSQQDGKALYSMRVDASADSLAYRYGYLPAGWWEYSNAIQAHRVAYAVTCKQVGRDPGPGWFGLPNGHLVGSPSGTPIFDGPLAMLDDSSLRMGARKQGDRFSDGTTTITILEDGFLAPGWLANTGALEYVGVYAKAGTTVSPSTRPHRREGGVQVWECTTEGTTHATTEPTWPGSPTPDVTTQADGSVTWTYKGLSPAYDVEQRVTKTRLTTRLSHTTTSTATANQVIESGAAVSGVDLALPPSSLCRITDLITVKKSATANGGTIEIKSDWIRNGTGAPAQVGSSVITYNLTGSTLDATTVAHVANGNTIELQASPESADALNFSVFRTQAEGCD